MLAKHMINVLRLNSSPYYLTLTASMLVNSIYIEEKIMLKEANTLLYQYLLDLIKNSTKFKSCCM